VTKVSFGFVFFSLSAVGVFCGWVLLLCVVLSPLLCSKVPPARPFFVFRQQLRHTLWRLGLFPNR